MSASPSQSQTKMSASPSQSQTKMSASPSQSQLGIQDNMPLKNNNIGRNKVALKQGRSLMDWIRFTHSSNDLASTNGQILEVSHDELSKHNKKNDAWICLKGKVYNVTPYFEYHPGGEDELMRGAGKDATDLFNQIHKWVNFESMLQKCYVGVMVPSVSKIFRKVSISDSRASLVQNLSKLATFDWWQTESSLFLLIHSNTKNIKVNQITIDRFARRLLITINLKSHCYYWHMELGGDVQDIYNVKVTQQNGTAEIIMRRVSSALWPFLGTPLSMHEKMIEHEKKELQYRPCKLVNKSPITHNTYMFTFSLPRGSWMMVPVGYHINIKTCIEEVEIIRCYTPVIPSLSLPASNDELTNGQNLHFMIKIYDSGTFTPILKSYQVGEMLLISDYLGNFSLDILEQCVTIFLFAAGTGLTPMIKIIHWFKTLDPESLKTGDEKFLYLMFFNRTEKDIIWRDELSLLSEENDRIKICHILSEPDDNWLGEKGHVNVQLLQKVLPSDIKHQKSFSCVCGPLSFTNCTVKCLKELAFSDDNIHAFAG